LKVKPVWLLLFALALLLVLLVAVKSFAARLRNVATRLSLPDFTEICR